MIAHGAAGESALEDLIFLMLDFAVVLTITVLFLGGAWVQAFAR